MTVTAKTLSPRRARSARNAKSCRGAKLDKTAPHPNLKMAGTNHRSRIAYQMISMLKGVTTRGTGARAHVELKNIVPVKPAPPMTSFGHVVSWVSRPDLVAGVFIGYDNPVHWARKKRRVGGAAGVYHLYERSVAKNPTRRSYSARNSAYPRRFKKPDCLRWRRISDTKIIDEAFIRGGPLFIPAMAVDPKRRVRFLSLNRNRTGSPVPRRIIKHRHHQSVPPRTQGLPPVVGTARCISKRRTF